MRWTPHSLSAHYPHIVILISLSPSFFAECLCLTFISPPLLFSPIGPERRLFCWPRALSLLKKKKPWTQTSVSELLNPYISMSRLIHLNLKCSEYTNMQIWKKISLELRSSTDLSMRNIEGKNPWIIQLMHFTHFLQHIPHIHTSTLSFVPLG